MIKLAKRNIALLLLGFVSCPFALATSLTLHITDQHGHPLENAVVEAFSSLNINAPSPSNMIMDQQNKRFVPTLLLVQKGQLVSFPNSDDIRHHVYSFSPAKAFELKLYAGQPKDPLAFEQAGVVVLGCNIHDAMVGYIYVANNNPVASSDKNGIVTLTLPADSTVISLWHAMQQQRPEFREQLPLAQLPTANASGEITLSIPTQSPPPRDTFESRFHEKP